MSSRHLLGSLFLLWCAACGEVETTFVDGGFDGDVDAPDEGAAPQTTLTVTPAALSNQATARLEFVADLPSSFSCRLDGGAAAPCTSPHAVPVADGPHLFEVTATSSGGIADATPAVHEWRVDTVAPDTAFDAVPPALDNSTTVRFEFHATEDATFTCAVDGAAAVPCASPYAVTGLSDGAHTLAVRATDLAGNAEVAPASHAWSIDSSTPDTRIDMGPTGAVAAATARFDFSSPDGGAGATFDCALDGAAFAACTSPRNLSGLAEGAHTFRVRVRDGSGNLDPTPAERTWTVDTIAPTVSIAPPATPTGDATPTFTFATGGAPTDIACRVDTAGFAPCTTATSHTPLALADGGHSFEVRVTDAAGNSASATATVTVDTTAPTVAIAPPATPTNDATPTFTFTTGGSPTSVACRMGAASFAPCSTTSSHTPAPLSPDGPHTLEVRVSDAAGNTSSATATIALDTVAPTVTAAAPAPDPTSDATPTFAFTHAGAPTSIQCRMGTAAFGACTTATSHTPSPLTDATHTFEVRVADDAGNASTATASVTIDTVAPTVAIGSFPSPTNDTTPTFPFTTGGAPSSVQCRMGTASFGPCTTSSSHTPAALAQGTSTFEVRVTDAAGNSNAATASVAVDTVAPGVNISSGPTGTIYTSTATFGFTTSGGATSTGCRVYRSGTAAPAYAPCTSPATMPMPSVTSPTAMRFDVEARDAANNAASATWTFTLDRIN